MKHILSAAMAMIFLVSPALSQSFSFFGTYWENRHGKSYEAVGLGIPASNMQKAFDAHADDGYEMTLIDGYDVEGQVFFNFVFRTRTSSSWVARSDLSHSAFQDVFDAQIDKGRCLRSLDVYRKNGRPRYAAIFKSHKCVPQRAYHGASAQTHQDRFEAFTSNGWDPVNVSVISIDGTRTYAAFYEKRRGASPLKSFLTRDALAEFDAKQNEKGRHIVYLNAYTHDQNKLPRFSAIWRKVREPVDARANLGGPQVADLGQDMHQSRKYVRYLTAFGLQGSHRYDIGAYRARASGGVSASGSLSD